jgi:hypothetical protein
MAKAVEQNKKVYSDAIQDKVEKSTGWIFHE